MGWITDTVMLSEVERTMAWGVPAAVPVSWCTIEQGGSPGRTEEVDEVGRVERRLGNRVRGRKGRCGERA